MSDPASDRVQELFDQSVELSAPQRAAFLDAACAGDPTLRAEVESLLAVDSELSESAECLLESPLVRLPQPIITAPPARIGCYRVLRRIAEGGMGTVYEAEQDNPRRRVALKVVRPSLDSPVVLKRFAQEAQVLGRLQHPGIAQVYEAGFAENGQPFIAMELIRGRSLIEYAQEKSLGLAARLELLAHVCDAIQYAHDRDVIHRDLKPANILVDETGKPKILDFGVARATDSDLLTAADLTQTGQLLGTPNYVSPEQVTAGPTTIDHRADVYSLGVILFELLAQRPPYRLENLSLAESVRLILEEDPPRLGLVAPELRGDVETIVAKAVEKNPARRYPSAAHLAADLRRFLAHEPILARPPSTVYRLGKLARRHKALVGGGAATAVALIAGLITSILFAVGETRQRLQAEHNAEVALANEKEALYQAYRARMAAAVAALSTHDVEAAKGELDAAPEKLRGWEWRHLTSRLDDSSSVTPLSVAVGAFLIGAPDRLRLGVLKNGSLHFEDLEGGEHRIVPLGSEYGNRANAVQTRLGLRVAIWVGRTSIHLLDADGRVLYRVEIPQAKQPEPIALSPDGTQLATHWQDGEWRRLAVFHAESGQQVTVCEGHRDGIWDITFSPDGRRLASVGEDQVARLWDPATGECLVTCRGHTNKVLGINFRPDGLRLTTASSDGTVRQWDAATGREIESPYERHTGDVAAVTYSPDGQWIASVGTDRTVRVWEAEGRKDVAVLHGHTGPIVQVAFASDGRRLASLSLAWIFSAGDDTVRVWEVNPRAHPTVLRGHTKAVYPVAYSPDGRWLASGSWDATVRLWDASTGEAKTCLPHPGVVPSLAYGPDGKWLVTGNYADDRLRIWDVASVRVRQEIRGPDGTFRFVTVSPDGQRLAATAYDGQHHVLQVCDIASGERLFGADGRALAYSPDGRWLATLAPDETTVLLLDAQSHTTAAQFPGHEQPVDRAVFSPDGRFLTSCSRDRTVRLWRIDGSGCQVLRGHTDEVFAAAFHPDGTRLATAGRDQGIWLWDLERGVQVARLPGHTSYVWSLDFSPSGTRLASGSGDATIRQWDTVSPKDRFHARRE